MNHDSNSPELVRLGSRAVDIARRNKHEQVTLEHLLAACLKEEDTKEAFEAMDVDIDDVEDDLNTFFKSTYLPISQNVANPPVTSTVQEVLGRAYATAKGQERGITTLDVILKMFAYTEEDSFAVSVLVNNSLTGFRLAHYMGDAAGQELSAEGDPRVGAGGGIKITNAEEAALFLEKYCVNLNEQAKQSKIDPLIGREDEVHTIVQITARRSKNNSVLVGEPGVGKTAIVEGLAKMIVEEQVPDILLQSVVYSLDVGALMAGTRYRGDMEERLKQCIKAFEFIEGSIVFIDEIHTIMGSGSGGGAMDIANLLKPALSKGTLRCIGSTTYEEFRKHFEKDRALLRRFKRVDVAEPSVETTKLILRGLAPKYAEFHGLTFTDEALDAAVDLTSRYVNTNLLPDKAIDILDSAGARQKIRPEAERLAVLDVAEIEFEVSKVAKIPEKTIKEDETDKLTRLEDDLRAKVYGQDQAIVAVANAVYVSRAGLRDLNKPAGAFMFAGPTGVGKTEISRQLADTLGVPLLKYDMSEYMEKHSVSKLIGSPPGYVGYEDGGAGSGKLINDIESHPYSILLLDELEKAHPDVFNIFLQALDDGSLTSSSGKKVSFRNVIVIMTTNAGAFEQSKASIGFGKASFGDPLDAIKKVWAPEFLNRLDAIVGFNRLQPEHVKLVVEKFLAVMQSQAAERNVIITVDDDAKAWLSKNGYDEAMGARPLGRAIHDNIKTPLSRLMTIGALKNGGNAFVTVEDGKIKVNVG